MKEIAVGALRELGDHRRPLWRRVPRVAFALFPLGAVVFRIAWVLGQRR